MQDGITPARAGKSVELVLQANHEWNYPRSRGEEASNWSLDAMALELPPLARGRDATVATLIGVAGITPARAGKRGG